MSEGNHTGAPKPGEVHIHISYDTFTGACRVQATSADEVLLRGVFSYALETLVKNLRDQHTPGRILPAASIPPGARSV